MKIEDIFYRMGSERRVEPGAENKIRLLVPGPTQYQIPSLVSLFELTLHHIPA